ncbi:MAG: STAS domain-containing protein [Firmicutes bacterium]|nr:STAS domain-containing protein [Bacillota bacterium]
MLINKIQENGKLILALDGKLDTNTSSQLQQVLILAFDDVKEIVLDFKNLAYTSSAGLRVLLLGQKTAIAKKASMTLCNVSEEIMEVFDMTGFSDMLTIL